MSRDKYLFYQEHYQQNICDISDYYKKIIDIINSYKPKKFLDFGCGDGSFTAVVQEKTGAKVYGVDISEKAIKEVKQKGINGTSLDIDSNDLQFEEKYFDLVFCGSVIEHVYSPDHLLQELYRVLKPGGILILVTPNMASWYNRISLLLGYQIIFSDISLFHSFGHLWKMGPMGHLRLYTLKSLKALFQVYDFKILNAYGIGINNKVGFGKKHPLISSIANFIFKNPYFNSQILIITQR